MKFHKSPYLAFFFLFCFTASFGVNAWQNLQTTTHICDFTHKQSTTFSSKEADSKSGTSMLLEKNENETEESLTIQSFTLPFYISYFQCEVFPSIILFTEPLTQRPTNPIYIEVCNFRI